MAEESGGHHTSVSISLLAQLLESKVKITKSFLPKRKDFPKVSLTEGNFGEKILIMTKKALIKSTLLDNQSQKYDDIWSRSLQIPTQTGKIITLAGVRRSGKTYHLFNLINQLKSQGVSPEQIIYFNFEDERLKMETKELDMILQSYRELYPKINLSDCYFFFDEIQEVMGWEKFVSRVYTSISKQVFVTGSNATLLSKEIATALRGRTITYEVYPLSFVEFVSVTQPNLNADRTADQSLLKSLFNQFLTQGGFPELVNQSADVQAAILQGYFNVMIIKDLIDRYQISTTATLRYFCKRVVANTGGEFSVNKIYHELKSQGYQVSKDTLYQFQEYVEAIYLNRFISKYSPSVVKAEFSQKKSYVIDQGLGVALDYKLSQDQGRLLETTLALELIKAGRQITYQKNGTECDFVTLDRGQVTQAIQVALDIEDPQTRDRELKGLAQTCRIHGLSQGTLVTLDHEEEVVYLDTQISITPAWRLCLGLK